MPNFPGAGKAIPQVVSEVVTESRGSSVPGGIRIAALIGEGQRQERIIVSALGGGNDGLNPTCASTTGSDGRHFKLQNVPIVSNRTTLYKNGIPLALLEQAPNSSPFDSNFDARIDVLGGCIELQTASLVDQGGSFYASGGLNVGNGTLGGLILVDTGAPSETWTVRCTSIRRDSFGAPVDGYAKFSVQGSVSGIILDGYGSVITWQSNGITTSNGILSFSITEGSVAFREGDRFNIQVKSGTLVKGDSLTATYIAVTDLNDPEFFTDMSSLSAKHGFPSLSNRLSLGSQLAFANGTPGVLAVEAAPSIPRRISYSLVTSAKGTATVDDLTFPLPLNVVPDANTNINFFVTDPVTGVETQLLPNKTAFYNPTLTANTNTFIFGAYVFAYTVVLETSVVKEGIDGVLSNISGSVAKLTSTSVLFDLEDLNGTRTIKIYDATHSANNGVAQIVSVANGVVTISKVGGFIAESNIRFEVLDSSDTSAQVLFTDDLALTAGQSLRAAIVDAKDASFYDAGWEEAYLALTKVDCDIVVPLPSQTISAIFAIGKQHVIDQSNIKNKHERVLFIGAINGLAPENLTGDEPAAVEDIGILEGIQGDSTSEVLAGDTEDLTNYSVSAAYGDSFRVMYFNPDQIVVQVGADRLLIDGFFISAAAAGFLSGTVYIATPLTNKTLAGFTILRNKLYNPLTLENLAASGICTLQPVAGGGTVIWGRTTVQSGFAEEEELSIVFIRDRVAKNMRAAFAGFVGMAETPTFISTLFQRADSVASSFISQRLITAYKDLMVQRDSVDPRQWNIVLAVQPTFPVNFIFIKVGIGVL